MRGKKGFTLVELLIVITIMTLLAGLIVVLVKGMIEKARVTKTHGIIKMLDEGCHSYKVDTGVFPPRSGFPDSRCLHLYLGKEREIPAQYVSAGRPAMIKKPPLIEFKTDMLDLPPGRVTTDPGTSPVGVIDAWGRVIQYAYPGQHNLKGFDIWSFGKDGIDDSAQAPPIDDVNNWIKEF